MLKPEFISIVSFFKTWFSPIVCICTTYVLLFIQSLPFNLEDKCRVKGECQELKSNDNAGLS